MVFAGITLLLFVVSHLLVVVVPIVGALFLTAILAPPAAWLRRRRLPALLATWIVFLAAVGLITGLLWWLVPSVAKEMGSLKGTLSKSLGEIRTWLTTGPLHVAPGQVDRLVSQLQEQASRANGVLLHGALAGAQLVAEVIAAVILTIVLTFFFVKDGEAIGSWVLGFIHASRRDRFRGAAHVAWDTFTAYVQGTAINGFINGVLMGVGLLVIGVPLALPIAVLTFFGGFFPLVGGILSGVVAILVALVAKGFGGALLVAGLTVLIHHVEGYLVGPIVLGRRVRLHAVVVLLSLAIGTTVGGVFGAFVAVPVVAVFLALVEFYGGLPVAMVSTTRAAIALPGARLAVIRRMTNRRTRVRDRSGWVPESDETIEPGPQSEDADRNANA